MSQLLASAHRLLQTLGFQSIHDIRTIVSLETFERISAEAVREFAAAHKFDLGPYEPLDDAEKKFVVVNRVLALHYEMIIDNTKQLDELPDGFKLEHVPC